MLKVLLLAVPAVFLQAQVTIRFTPEPMAVPMAAISNARDMGRWSVVVCNDTPSPVSIASERIDLAAGPIQLIDVDDAKMVLAANQQRTLAGSIAKYGGTAAQILALGLAVASRANLPTSAALSLGSTIIPQLTGIAQANLPIVTPLYSNVQYPVRLEPGGCFTDHRFAAKTKAPKVVTGQIVLGGAFIARSRSPDFEVGFESAEFLQ